MPEDPRPDLARQNAKVKRSWAKRADSYDKQIGFIERRFFGIDHRAWACAKARGETLEVAVGTGLNLTLYGGDVRLTGIDLSPEMLSVARRRADELDREVTLREGDAHQLPFADEAFETVVCTYSLCNIPDPRRAVAEMHRVLRPKGSLILVDHISSSVTPLLWMQKAIEFFTIRLEGEHMTRRSLEHVSASGFDVIERERSGAGEVVERIVAMKRS